MDEVDVVTCVLRHRDRVLLLQRSEDVGSYRGRWGMVAGHAEGRPDDQAWVEIEEETGLADHCTLVRAGDPFDVTDENRGTRWTVHPYLFDCDAPDVETDEETTEWEWVSPPEILDRDTVPDLWTSYRSVAPTVETVRADDDHGSAYLSVRALDVLRDAAAEGASWNDLAALARDLRDARDMVAVATRVDRAMTDADGDAAALVDAAQAVGDAALDADDAAANAAAARVEDETVVTLSRSGTVLRALRTGDPTRVVVAESRPAREGVDVAETLADAGLDVALTTDAAAPGSVADADRVLVGADAVDPDGGVANKTGTYPLALAAERAGVPFDVACAADKIDPDPIALDEESPHDTVYDGDADLAVDVPLFERVPPDLVTAVVTEDGSLDADDVSAVAEEHRQLRDWK